MVGMGHRGSGPIWRGARTVPAQRPDDCDRLFGDHLNAGDLEGLMALYEPGCRLVRRDGSVAVGHVEIRVVLGRLVEMRRR
jgi:hypothetical protein